MHANDPKKEIKKEIRQRFGGKKNKINNKRERVMAARETCTVLTTGLD